MESGVTSDTGVDLALPDRVTCQGPSHAPPVAALGGHCRGVGLVWSPAGVRLAEEPRLPPGPQTQSSLRPGLSAAQLCGRVTACSCDQPAAGLGGSGLAVSVAL